MLNTMPQLKVLRKVTNLSAGSVAYLNDEYARRRQAIDPDTGRLRNDVIHPGTGWVDNDIPRDEFVSMELIENTTGYAVAGYLGQIVREFKDFETADKARRNATVSLDVKVDVPDDEIEDEAGDGALAGEARRQRALKPGH